MHKNEKFIVGEVSAERLDAYLAEEVPELSRSQWKTLIKKGAVTVNGSASKPNHRISEGDEVFWSIPQNAPAAPLPEEIAFDVLFEDDAVLVLNKPPGLVVHPAAGNESGTLVNALLFHGPEFKRVDRAGIVHRLDKDTSGVMVVAKSEIAMAELQRQFKARETEKEYLALVWGHPSSSGCIKTQIGRHPIHRQKMAVLKTGGREAVSHFQVMEEFRDLALVKVRIETGRTHQIRVHMAHIRHPVIGDRMYGRSRKARLPQLPDRQQLHASRLEFNHPFTGNRLSFEAPLFDDMQQLLERLRRD